MGECAYRIKAKWRRGIPQESRDLIEKLLEENREAYNYWQENRSKKAAEFWPEFEKRFPASTEYAKFIKAYNNDPYDDMSGKFDFGQDDAGMGFTDYVFSLESDGVWHFADWQPLADWLEHLGAHRVIWDSEENQSDCFDFYDWGEIVARILEKKELLPLLKGITDDLDELIAEGLEDA